MVLCVCCCAVLMGYPPLRCVSSTTPKIFEFHSSQSNVKLHKLKETTVFDGPFLLSIMIDSRWKTEFSSIGTCFTFHINKRYLFQFTTYTEEVSFLVVIQSQRYKDRRSHFINLFLCAGKEFEFLVILILCCTNFGFVACSGTNNPFLSPSCASDSGVSIVVTWVTWVKVANVPGFHQVTDSRLWMSKFQ